jgi:hypothetical protein
VLTESRDEKLLRLVDDLPMSGSSRRALASTNAVEDARTFDRASDRRRQGFLCQVRIRMRCLQVPDCEPL